MMDAGFTMIDNDAIKQAAKIGPTAFVVYVALALHVDERRECWPSVGRLSKITGLCERAVQNAIRKLRRYGWVTVTAGGGTTPNHYKLASIPPVVPVNADAPLAIQGMNVDVPTGAFDAPDPRTNMHHPGASTCTLTIPIEQEPLTKPKNKTHRRKAAAVAETPIPVALDVPAFHEVWEKWKQHRKEKNKKLTPTSIKEQFVELESWGVDRAIAAITHSIRKGWTGIFEPNGDTRNGNSKRTIGPGQQYDPAHVSEGL